MCGALFSIGFSERWEATKSSPGFADGSWRSHSVFTARFARQWYEVGWLESKLRLHFTAHHVVTRSQPNIYSSYPSGFLVPVYLWVLLVRQVPNLEMVMQMSVWLFLFTGFLAGLFAYLWCRQGRYSLLFSLLLGACSAAFYFFSAAASRYYPATWWPDTLAPTWFLLLLLHEFFLRKRIGRALVAWEFTLFFAACFTDWLLVLLVFAIAFLRRLRGDSWRESLMPLSGLIAVLLHLWTVVGSGYWQSFLGKVALRTSGLVQENVGSESGSWLHNFESHFGGGTFTLFLAVGVLAIVLLIWRVWKRGRSPSVDLFLLLTLPCYLHALVLLQHYRGHPYNVLKWAMIFALLPAVLIFPGRKWLATMVAVVGLSLGYATFSYRETPGDGWLEAKPENIAICEMLSRHQTYYTIMFTPDTPWGDALISTANCYYPLQSYAKPMDAFKEFIRVNWRRRFEEKIEAMAFFRKEPSSEWRAYLGQRIESTPNGTLYSVSW